MSDKVNRSVSGSWSLMSETILSEKFPLHLACRDGDVGYLTTLLQAAEAKEHLIVEDTYYGWTPTHWAAYFGKLECLRTLRCSNTDGATAPIDIRTSRFNQTPAHIAAFAGHPHCLLWLIQAGAHLDAKDYLGETPLHKAARTGSAECVSLIAASKVDVCGVNNNGQTSTQLASACGFTDLSQQLFQLEAAQVRDRTSSITCSIPSHGLNGGTFPPNESAVKANGQSFQTVSKPPIPSNGYYGYQPISSSTNGSTVVNNVVAPTSTNNSSDDCDMETDSVQVKVTVTNGQTKHTNGQTIPVINGTQVQNGFMGATNGTNGQTIPVINGTQVQNGFMSATNGTNGTNESMVMSPHDHGDITINREISQNNLAVGGRKRSREEVLCLPSTKRLRQEESSYEPPQITTMKKEPSEKVVEMVEAVKNSPQNSAANNSQIYEQASISGLSLPTNVPSHNCATMARARSKQQWIWVI